MDLDPASLFSELDTGETLVAAVSGGSDSIALLLLAADFLRRHRRSVRLVAVTVDHRLRPESAAEALCVAALCARHGVAHETVAWTGDKPRAGLAAAAREARYRLLADAARRLGASVVLAGHTLDDQAETLAMRAARGDGLGLAGMARATLYDGRVWIVRPLLDLRRPALRDWLAGRGTGWIDDPSNDNPAYERVRVRQRLDAAEIAALGARARAHGQERAAMATQAAELIRRFADRPAPGLLRLDRGIFARRGDRQDAAAMLALRALLATAGGMPRLPDPARGVALFERLRTGAIMRATLARVAIDSRRAGVFLRREARSLPSVPLGDEPVLWDGRLRAAALPGAAGLGARGLDPAGLGGAGSSLGPLGDDRARRLAAPPPRGVPPALAVAALAAEPALSCADAPLGWSRLPGDALPGVSAAAAVAPFARFLPGFDLPLAAALHDLVGAPALPAAPWPERPGPSPMPPELN